MDNCIHSLNKHLKFPNQAMPQVMEIQKLVKQAKVPLMELPGIPGGEWEDKE